jgi:hypothetical protein
VVTVGVLDVGNVEGARVSLDVLEDTDSADVVTTDDQNLGTILVLDKALNFTGLEVQLLPNRGYLILKLFKEN